MIVKNEADNIREALQSSVQFADEIVIVDTGSTDRTVEVAKSYTPHVYHYAWRDDFAGARNFSLEKAGGSYCLWLDADDRIDEPQVANIQSLKEHFDGEKAFAFELQDVRNGQLCTSVMQIRCIPNRPDVRFHGRVHESIDWRAVQDPVQVVDTDIVVRHYGYNDPAILARKRMRNLRLLTMEREAGRDDATLHYYLATSLGELGESQAAVKHLSKCISKLELERFHAKQKDVELLELFFRYTQLLFAKELVKLGKIHEAKRSLAKLRCRDGLDPVTLFRMGELCQVLKDHVEAVRLFDRVDPRLQVTVPVPMPRIREKDVAVRAALSLLALGNDAEALARLESVADSTDWKDIWEELGIWAVEADLPLVAERAFSQALLHGGLSAQAWTQWGAAWKALGNTQKAEQWWRRALAVAPEMEGALIHLANHLWAVKKEDEAYPIFRKLLGGGCLKIPVILAFSRMALERGDEQGLLLAEDTLAFMVQCGLENSTRSYHPSPSPFTAVGEALEAQGKKGLAALAKRLQNWREWIPRHHALKEV